MSEQKQTGSERSARETAAEPVLIWERVGNGSRKEHGRREVIRSRENPGRQKGCDNREDRRVAAFPGGNAGGEATVAEYAIRPADGAPPITIRIVSSGFGITAAPRAAERLRMAA